MAHKNSPSQIKIEAGITQRVGQIMKKIGKRFIIISDKNVELHGEKVRAALRRIDKNAELYLLPNGEEHKTLSTVEKLCSFLAQKRIQRDGCLIAVGGGVVGDMVGLAASIYMRGINYVAVPTTVLAMADSSIGGKTGVDLVEGKNLIGTFYQPRVILIDPFFLKTLHDVDFRSGFAEIIKHGIIASKELFMLLEKNVSAVMRRDTILLEKILKKSAAIKMSFVKCDEKESITGINPTRSRMLLNYGHTVGHAIEKLSSYSMRHGEAVSIGMVAENRIAVAKKLLKESDSAAIKSLLTLYKLPTAIPTKYSTQDIKRVILCDKKRVGDKLYFALPTKIGAARLLAYDLL